MTGAATGIGRATADVLEARGFAVARNHLPGQAVSGLLRARPTSPTRPPSTAWCRA